MKRKVSCVLLAFVLAFTGSVLFNTSSADAAVYSSSSVDSTVKERLNELSQLDGTYFTTDGKPAGGSGVSKCEVTNVLKSNTKVRTLNKSNKGAYKPAYNSYMPSYYTHNGKILSDKKTYSCAGFAMYAEWFLFADKYNNKVETYLVARNYNYTYNNMKKYAKVGDIIWTSGSYSSGHASIVVSIGTSGVKVIDSNTWNNPGDANDNKVRVHTIDYKLQSKVTISRVTNYYIHYSDNMTATSYTADSRTIHNQVARHGINTTLQSKKFTRSGYSYSKYYICKNVNGTYYYLCRNKNTKALKWLKKSSITSAYSRVYAVPGGTLVLGKSVIGWGQEIVLYPVWVKK